MELRCENRVDSINSGHAVRSRVVYTEGRLAMAHGFPEF